MERARRTIGEAAIKTVETMVDVARDRAKKEGRRRNRKRSFEQIIRAGLETFMQLHTIPPKFKGQAGEISKVGQIQRGKVSFGIDPDTGNFYFEELVTPNEGDQVGIPYYDRYESHGKVHHTKISVTNVVLDATYEVGARDLNGIKAKIKDVIRSV